MAERTRKKAEPKKAEPKKRDNAYNYKKVEIEFKGRKQVVSEDVAEVLRNRGLI